MATKPETTVQDDVSTFINMKPPDILSETWRQNQCDVCLHQAGRAKDEVLFRMKATQGKREPNREHD